MGESDMALVVVGVAGSFVSFLSTPSVLLVRRNRRAESSK